METTLGIHISRASSIHDGVIIAFRTILELLRCLVCIYLAHNSMILRQQSFNHLSINLDRCEWVIVYPFSLPCDFEAVSGAKKFSLELERGVEAACFEL